ncbi:hypothetical protein HMPREF1570_2956 [Klebsiella oxytoca KA-2]|nr:hypothetical protein HMPREF1570_2956 [Klebsiella oxytoca KA-2]
MCRVRGAFLFFSATMKSLQDINSAKSFRFADCISGRFQA